MVSVQILFSWLIVRSLYSRSLGTGDSFFFKIYSESGFKYILEAGSHSFDYPSWLVSSRDLPVHIVQASLYLSVS